METVGPKNIIGKVERLSPKSGGYPTNMLSVYVWDKQTSKKTWVVIGKQGGVVGRPPSIWFTDIATGKNNVVGSKDAAYSRHYPGNDYPARYEPLIKHLRARFHKIKNW